MAFLLLLGPCTLLIFLLSPLDVPSQSICDFSSTRAPQTLGFLRMLSSLQILLVLIDELTYIFVFHCLLDADDPCALSSAQTHPELQNQTSNHPLALSPWTSHRHLKPSVFKWALVHLGFEKHHHSQICSSQKPQDCFRILPFSLTSQLVIKTCQLFL